MNYLFSSRRDIETLMLIIQEWQQVHPGDSKFEYSEEIFDKLDYMFICW